MRLIIHLLLRVETKKGSPRELALLPSENGFAYTTDKISSPAFIAIKELFL